MNILIITAHPSTKGFTHKIADAYFSEAVSHGHQTEILDLYAPEWQQNFLRFEDINEIEACPKRDVLQAKIKASNRIVFIFPLWWMGPPAILKNFIDVNLTPGFAYKYRKFPILKGIPIGLLSGRTADVFITCDGPKWFYKFFLTPFKLNLKMFTLNFCGIKTKNFMIFDRMRWRTDGEKQKWLAHVKKIAK